MTTTEWKREPAGLVESGPFRTAYELCAGRPLALATIASFLLYVALCLIDQSHSFRLTQTLTFDLFPVVGRVASVLTPDRFIRTSWKAPNAIYNELIYLVIALALIAVWMFALWHSRPGAHQLRLRWVLMPIALFALPMIWVPGMTSGDLYLYMFYGREIAKYGANPIVYAPDHFSSDPHFLWVNWPNLPSAYGPLWLMLSAGLSAVAGDGLFSNILAYKVAVLVMHLLATAAVYLFLKEVRPELATWGAIFYGWNPMVIFETIASGHNDVMMALFVGLSLIAAMRRRWLFAVGFLMAAVMVKASALLLLPPLLIVWLLTLEGWRRRARAAVVGAVVALAVALALYAPLWAGGTLVENIRTNPAARAYQNTLWQMVALRFAVEPSNRTARTMDEFLRQQAVYDSVTAKVDVARNVVFAIAALYVLYRLVYKRMRLDDAWIWLWFAYCATLAWIWPWYFVLGMPLAAIRGPGRTVALSVGMTVGGMLFWLGWPPYALPAAPWLFGWRAALLMFPPLAVALLPWLSSGIERIVGREAATG